MTKWWGLFCLWQMGRCYRHAQVALKIGDDFGTRAYWRRATVWERRALRAGQDPLPPDQRRAKLGHVNTGENNARP